MVELKTKSQAKSSTKKKKTLSILLVCPLAIGETRLHDLTWQSIQDLLWDQPVDILLMRDDAPDSPHMSNLTAKLNHARSLFLQGNYDAMFVVESDMVVPPHALLRLTRVKADVAYGVYCTRRADYRWLAYAALGDRNGEGPVVKAEWGKVVETRGVGFGCTLIQRRVLEAFEFREGQNGEGADWNLAKDLEANGYRQAHDFGVLCGHILTRNAPHQIVWPIEEPPYHKIDDLGRNARNALAEQAHDGTYIALKPILSQRTGKTLQPGETIELSAALAADFLRRKIVDVIPTEGEL